jgi:hypothetical protein
VSRYSLYQTSDNVSQYSLFQTSDNVSRYSLFQSSDTVSRFSKWHKPWWHYSSLKHWCFPRSYVNNFYIEIILFELASCIALTGYFYWYHCRMLPVERWAIHCISSSLPVDST